MFFINSYIPSFSTFPVCFLFAKYWSYSNEENLHSPGSHRTHILESIRGLKIPVRRRGPDINNHINIYGMNKEWNNAANK